MKKQAKKLKLAKETLRNLDASRLRRVGAAVYTQDGGIGCTQPADTNSCGSCVGCNQSASCEYTCSWNNTGAVIEPQSRNCTAP